MGNKSNKKRGERKGGEILWIAIIGFLFFGGNSDAACRRSLRRHHLETCEIFLDHTLQRSIRTQHWQ
jgi:hypothetical protein